MRKRQSGLKQGAWVVVADGEKALFLVNEGDDMDMNLTVIRKDKQENPQAQEWAADRPGRFNDGPSVQRSAVDDTDWHALEKERFASALADRLYEYSHKGAFDALANVASRVVLSQLRQELHKEVQASIILEVPKVLTNHPVNDIEKHLAEELAEASNA